MIAHLRGQVFEKHPNRLVVDVAGVGYDVQVPLSTFYTAGEPGSEIALRIHTHVREDQLSLRHRDAHVGAIDVWPQLRHRPRLGRTRKRRARR